MSNSTPHILLIDDEKGVLSALKLVLTKVLGYQVSDYSNSLEALTVLKSGELKPDWIVSDLRMPDADGLDVLKARNDNCADIPFILISGHATEEDKKKALSLGAIAVVRKPFAPQELQKIIEQNALESVTTA